jgi:CheY-like chemotaxis protein
MRTDARQAVIIIEGNRELRDLLADILREEGYAVAAAAGAEIGLALLRATPRRAVVLLDVPPALGLPLPQDGLAVLRAMQRDESLARQHAYVLITSSPERVRALVGRLPEQVSLPVVRKPFDLDTLLDAIARQARHLEATRLVALAADPERASLPEHRSPQDGAALHAPIPIRSAERAERRQLRAVDKGATAQPAHPARVQQVPSSRHSGTMEAGQALARSPGVILRMPLDNGRSGDYTSSGARGPLLDSKAH